MGKPDYYAEMARRAVKRVRREPPASLPADRRRLVAAVEQALHTRGRRRVMIRRVRAMGAVAASLALVVGGWALWQRLGVPGVAVNVPGPEVAGGSADHTLAVLGTTGGDSGSVIGGAGETPVVAARGLKLDAGARVVAPSDGEMRIGGAEGTLLALEHRGELAVAEAGTTRRFTLHTGAVRAKVVKLGPGERFLVDTADTEVEVHGTEFRVAVAPPDPGCSGGPVTRVSVTEGVVSVRWHGAEARVLPGGQWPAPCATHAAAPAPVRPEIRIVAHAPSRAPHVAAAPPPVAVAEPIAREAPPPPPEEAPPLVDVDIPAPRARPRQLNKSELAESNRLFERAVTARKSGDQKAALFLFKLYERQFPSGPLVESALIERMKLVAARNPEAGARLAAEYLQRFPGGVAKADAQRLLVPDEK
jgi:ferric-dicitrate binding protein FerR (iron transport regulator)